METKKVSQLQGAEYFIIQDTHEINSVLEHIGSDFYYPCLIVKVEDGEYKEVWGTDFIPYLDNLADRLL